MKALSTRGVGLLAAATVAFAGLGTGVGVAAPDSPSQSVAEVAMKKKPCKKKNKKAGGAMKKKPCKKKTRR